MKFQVTDYLEVVQKPMDLERIREKIDCMEYETVKGFVDDVEMVSENAIEYNPPEDHTSRQIRHRAAELKDTLHSLLDAQLDEDFAKLCEEIQEGKERRRQNQELASKAGGASRAGQSGRSSRDSGGLQDSQVSVSHSNGSPLHSHGDVTGTLGRIVSTLEGASSQSAIRLYTLIHQIIMKYRGNDKNMTSDLLLRNHIEPTISAFRVAMDNSVRD